MHCKRSVSCTALIGECWHIEWASQIMLSALTSMMPSPICTNYFFVTVNFYTPHSHSERGITQWTLVLVWSATIHDVAKRCIIGLWLILKTNTKPYPETLTQKFNGTFFSFLAWPLTWDLGPHLWIWQYYYGSHHRCCKPSATITASWLHWSLNFIYSIWPSDHCWNVLLQPYVWVITTHQ